MKKILITLLLPVATILLISSCATKIPFEQSCLTCVQSQRLNCKGSDCPETVMAGVDCIAIFDETGEKITMNYILEQEKIAVSKGIPISLAKVRGRYFVTGKDFKSLWMLTPTANEAKVKQIKFPFPDAKISLPPVFELLNGNLLMRSAVASEYSYTYDIDNDKWIINTTKTGA